jgi:hypothetical protein
MLGLRIDLSPTTQEGLVVSLAPRDEIRSVLFRRTLENLGGASLETHGQVRSTSPDDKAGRYGETRGWKEPGDPRSGQSEVMDGKVKKAYDTESPAGSVRGERDRALTSPVRGCLISGMILDGNLGVKVLGIRSGLDGYCIKDWNRLCLFNG